jgi:3-dehydroquinate synthase
MKKIIIGKNLLVKINTLIDFRKFSKVSVLTDENIPKVFIEKIEEALKQKIIKIIIPPGETEKNIETVKKIWKKMLENGLDRRSLLINLGGGVISDMGGFAAATYMRGIDFLNIPTTLLAQVDAGIGGKTGIDFLEIKNGIGVFREPILTVIDVDTLVTLPKRELRAAFGEIIKHGVISGREDLDLATSKQPEQLSQSELIKIIGRSINIKSGIVKKDPKERDLRKVLNFGHTIGHAIESLSWKTEKPLLHGEAVALGMIIESQLANKLGILSNEDLKIIEKSIRKAGLMSNTLSVRIPDILKMIASDKKNIKGEILLSLPKSIGKVVPNIKISPQKIKSCLQSLTTIN